MFHSIICSPVDALQWMGAVRMRVQTADKNITIIHTTPVHQLTSWEDKRCMFVKNKSIIIRHFLHFNVQLKSSVYNYTSSSKKSISSESGEKSAQIKHHLQGNTVQNDSKQICGWILIWATIDGLFHWRKPYYGLLLWTGYFNQGWRFEVKNILLMDLFLTNTVFVFTRH